MLIGLLLGSLFGMVVFKLLQSIMKPANVKHADIYSIICGISVGLAVCVSITYREAEIDTEIKQQLIDMKYQELIEEENNSEENK